MKAPWTRKRQRCAQAPGHSLPDLDQETELLNCMQFSCTRCSTQTPEPGDTGMGLGQPGQGLHLARSKGMKTATSAQWRCLDRGFGNASLLRQSPVIAASAGRLGCTMQTRPKSWSIMLDFAGITPSAILVKKWRGNRCTRLSGPIFPRTLCQHRYIWKLNDYHPRQRKRAL